MAALLVSAGAHRALAAAVVEVSAAKSGSKGGSSSSSSGSSSGRGFGKPSALSPSRKKQVAAPPPQQQEQQQMVMMEGEDEEEDGVVPEVVTNRMLRRMAVTVGGPMGVGVLFFGLYYYLKAVQRQEWLPPWLPLLTSFLTFGAAGLGITYAVVSASWDPRRPGSLLGWTEAQANWPLIWRPRNKNLPPK